MDAPANQSPPAARVALRHMGITALISLAVIWGWVAAVPMAFMDPEYPAWRAKLALVDRCELGRLAILGDSRAAADILPERLPLRAVNLAVGGGEPVEALAMARRMLTCPDPPRQVIVSFDPGHFARPDLLWERSVRYGLLTPADLEDLRRTTNALHDESVYAGHRVPGVPDRVRDWLHRVRFPGFWFSSLLHGGVALRWFGNARVFARTSAAGGHYYFGTSPGSDTVAADGHLPTFQPLPVLDAYFDRLLALLDSHGVDVWFVPMPINQATWDAVTPALRDGFQAYLRHYERRYASFHVMADIMPHWPNRYFGDQFCHLNPEGAERFSAWLAQRLQAAPPSTQNEAQNGWFSDTGREASFSVAPSSNRGS